MGPYVFESIEFCALSPSTHAAPRFSVTTEDEEEVSTSSPSRAITRLMTYSGGSGNSSSLKIEYSYIRGGQNTFG